MAGKNITKKMHFIPQMYLKHFADESGRFYMLNVKERVIKYARYQSAFYEDFFYSIVTGVEDDFGQALEEAFSKIEAKASGALEDFKETITSDGHVSDDMMLDISGITTFFFLRTRAFRDYLKYMDQAAADSCIKLLEKFDKASDDQEVVCFGKAMTVREIKEIPERMNKDNTNHYKSMESFWDIYHSAFFCKNWRVYIASGKELFITFDNPVMDIHNKDAAFWGNTIIDRKHYFVVSPQILIEFVDPEQQSKRLKRKRVDDKFVLQKNLELAIHSNGFIVSKDRKLLDMLITCLRGGDKYQYKSNNNLT